MGPLGKNVPSPDNLPRSRWSALPRLLLAMPSASSRGSVALLDSQLWQLAAMPSSSSRGSVGTTRISRLWMLAATPSSSSRGSVALLELKTVTAACHALIIL